MVSHRNLAASVANLLLGTGHERHPRMVQPFPQSHISAYAKFGCYAVADTQYLMPAFDTAAYLHMVESEQITANWMAAAMLGMLLDREDLVDVDVSSIRTMTYGASGISPTLLRRAMSRFVNADFIQGYGMTELAGSVVWLDAEAHRAGVTHRPDLLVTAGRPAPLAAVRIVDDAGTDLPVGAAGEIAVRGTR